MTIALGILASDGIVVAADTQVTVPGYLKMDEGKIGYSARRVPSDPSGPTCMIVSGAGAETSTIHLRRGLQGAFTDRPTVMTMPEIHNELETQILSFHAKHVVPHGNGTLDVWMLVAAFNDTGKKLWATDKSVVTEYPFFSAVGAGAMYARIVMHRLFAPMSTVGAILLASYVVWQVKQTVDGCGNHTDIVAMRRDRAYWINRDRVTQLEEIFEQYSQVTVDVMRNVFCDQIGWNDSPRNTSADIRRLRRKMGKLIQDSIEQPNEF